MSRNKKISQLDFFDLNEENARFYSSVLIPIAFNDKNYVISIYDLLSLSDKVKYDADLQDLYVNIKNGILDKNILSDVYLNVNNAQIIDINKYIVENLDKNIKTEEDRNKLQDLIELIRQNVVELKNEIE